MTTPLGVPSPSVARRFLMTAAAAALVCAGLAACAESTAPAAPTLSARGEVGDIRLSWTATDDADITSYSLYRADSPSDPFVLIAEGLPTGDFQDTTLPAGAEPTYEATVTSADGESAHSNSATAMADDLGEGSSDAVSCLAEEECRTSTVSSASDSGADTSAGLVVDASAAEHVATVGVGGPDLVGCSTGDSLAPGEAGLSVTFNDTSADAHKVLTVTLTGADADAVARHYPSGAGPQGCLGLGAPWFSATSDSPAVWSPDDGLYVASVGACKDSDEFALEDGLFSQPCFTATASLSGPTSRHSVTYEIALPPGDGRLSGGSP